MIKFKVIELDDIDKEIGLKIDDVVDFVLISRSDIYLCELPIHLHGKGIEVSNTGHRLGDFWYFRSNQLEEIKE